VNAGRSAFIILIVQSARTTRHAYASIEAARAGEMGKDFAVAAL
jgi:hypothetical protein